ncbi:MAG: hypothetical protein RR806_02265 [Oscillospiraceae bacterium]
MTDIYFVAHCVLNVASKTIHNSNEDYIIEEKKRQLFLNKIHNENAQLVQLPCPEFLIYGHNRWGHARSQFDNPFYIERCEELLKPFVLQALEYKKYPDEFNIVSVIGINGSPSCGVNFSFDSDNWKGEISTISSKSSINQTFLNNEMGVFIEVFSKMLNEKNIEIPFVSL